MLGGKNKHQHQGYTIVEVMIVLAVSGIMFLIAANFISGKQERTAFTQGSNELVAQIQRTVEDVTDGHYSDIPVNCTTAGAGSLALSFSLSASLNQGGNQSCVFLGKLIHFYTAAAGEPIENYQIFSLAAARQATGAIGSVPVYAIPTLTTKGTIPQKLYVTNMTVVNASGATVTPASYNIGFSQGLGTVEPGTTAYQSGAQSISLVYATSLNNLEASESNIAGTVVKPAQSATICLTDGVRKAKLLIGGTDNNSSQLNITAAQQGLGTVCT